MPQSSEISGYTELYTLGSSICFKKQAAVKVNISILLLEAVREQILSYLT